MVATPSDIRKLAIERHQSTWNWTMHFAAVIGFGLTLLFHSYILLACSTVLFGAGFFKPGLPVLRETRWTRFVARAVEWEKNWIAAPWNSYKIWRFTVVLLLATIAIWALWTGDAVVLALFVGFGFLVHVVRDNMAGGIKP